MKKSQLATVHRNFRKTKLSSGFFDTDSAIFSLSVNECQTLLFDEFEANSGRLDDEVEKYPKDRDTDIGMLDNYPQIQLLFDSLSITL